MAMEVVLCSLSRSVRMGKMGVAVSQMSQLPAAVYLGKPFDSNMSAIIPKTPELLLPILAFCSSVEYQSAVRTIDDSIKPTNSTLVKVPFDLRYWQEVASDLFPSGLPDIASTNLRNGYSGRN